MTYWIAAVILTVLNAICASLNLLMLPGNWLMVATLCVFLLVAGDANGGPGWTTLLIVIGLAVIGEIIESFAGSAKAAKAGASRRAMLLSLVLSFAGSFVGMFLIPVPVIGSTVGAVTGAAAGAFGGAWMGEAWIGTDIAERGKIGRAAMTGRLWGMLGKVAIGAAIFVIQLVSLW